MKKQIALVAVCAAMALCVLTAGCTSPTASPTPSASRSSSAVTSTAHDLTPSATDTAATPTSSATPSSSSSGESAKGLSLMFFYRPTCPKCQATEPLIKQIETNYTGKVVVTRINDDDAANADLISQQRVSVVPTVILLNNGVEVQRWVYPIDSAAVTGQIDSSLSAG